MADEKKIILSEPTQLVIRGKEFTVYPISIATFIALDKYITKLEKEKSIAIIGGYATEIVYAILVESGNKITKEDVAKTMTMEAFQHIVQAAMGKIVNIIPSNVNLEK